VLFAVNFNNIDIILEYLTIIAKCGEFAAGLPKGGSCGLHLPKRPYIYGQKILCLNTLGEMERQVKL
jgi:hypothetical protein